ncbi:MAG: alpha/beta fold hydrolase [Pseudonocardiaceae bacterium]
MGRVPQPARVALLARLRRHRIAVLLVTTLIAGAGLAVAVAAVPDSALVSTENVAIEVPEGPGRTGRLQLDATVYRPASTPAPAVLLAHGFGQDKHAVSAEATELARRGFVVLAWSARGFGESAGLIGLNSPDYEVADARALLDWLATRPDVVQDGPGDPRVGVTGASYGGALALLLAGTDPRVDALAPLITWNDLSQALFPNAASSRPISAATPAAGVFAPDGVFKRDWAGLFFGAGAGGPNPGNPEPGNPEPGNPGPCGRFRPEVCAAYTQAAVTGAPTPGMVALLRRSSPASVAGRVTAPTLLVQGEQDTLFGLDQADATARQLAAAGASLKVIWYAGGHDGEEPGEQVRDEIGAWFGYHLAQTGDDPGTGFDYQVRGAFGAEDFAQRTVTAAAYPGLPHPGQLATAPQHTGPQNAPGNNIPAENSGVQRQRFALYGEPQPVLRPPGASPAAVTSLPGLGRVGSDAAGIVEQVAGDLPGQAATFSTEPLSDPVDVAGAPQVRLRIAVTPGAAPAPGEAVLFVKLYDVGPGGRRTLPGAAVAPLRIRALPGDGTPVEVTVTLAGVVRPVEAGHRLVVAVVTTDRGYAVPVQPAGYTVALAEDAGLAVPVVPGEQVPVPLPRTQLAGLGGLAALVTALGVLAALRSRRPDDSDPGLADVPLVVSGLSKRYPDGITAVDELSFRVSRGQVLGLLGPNGAGKTTVLRMLMGLIRPSTGELRAFGHRVTAGAAVLSRIGSFVEGPGFLPHLSGAQNLRLYWAATGRPTADAGIEEALEIAGLGNSVHRRVATYSQGMRQRLAIAQAMLGTPDLLVLDEPTNGLDPPQIHTMRDVLRSYAARGRTVLVSSHLLAEVEQTCSHVVVMHRGRLVAAGTVTEIIAGSGTVSFTVDDPGQAAAVLRELAGVDVVGVDRSLVLAKLDGPPRAAVVSALVEAGVAVEGVSARHRLEEAFLQLVGEDTVE